MGSVVNNPDHGGPNGTATVIAPGTPISGGTGSFTSLATSLGLVSTANWGSQAKFGIAGQAGKIELARGNDGGFTAGIGFTSAAEAGTVEIFNSGGAGNISIKLNRASSGFSEAIRFLSANDGSLSIGNITATARLHLPAGSAAVGRAPFKVNLGVLTTVAEIGAEEYPTGNERHYTGGDGVRRRYMFNGEVIRLKAFTVASLPAGTEGDRAYVTDASAPTYNGALTGGGTVKIPVFFNGTAWVSA